MLATIRTLIADKRILIIGFGKEGQSTFRTLTHIGGYAQLDIADRVMQRPELENQHRFINGDTYMDTMNDYHLVFKSPGIILPQKPAAYRCRITSQTELFIQCYSRQVIGVTGTKGKSTVASLIHHLLTKNGTDCLLAGNIGKPVFDIAEQISARTVIVLELSCHQLEYCTHSPVVSLLLNLYEDHLDRYPTFAQYTQTKTNIYAHQSALDTLFCHPNFLPPRDACLSRIIPVNTACLPFTRFENINVIHLRGTHNLLNCAFAYHVCKTFNIDDDAFISALRTYQPLPHRLEFIGNKNGVDYYDDSISTTVESTVNALNSIPNADVVLLGGMDRGIDFTALVDFLLHSSVTYIILMYESGQKIYDLLCKATASDVTAMPAVPIILETPSMREVPTTAKVPSMPEVPSTTAEQRTHTIVHVPDLQQAVKLAQRYALPGKACVLSPAAASYGDFKNFEERGDVFKKLVM